MVGAAVPATRQSGGHLRRLLVGLDGAGALATWLTVLVLAGQGTLLGRLARTAPHSALLAVLTLVIFATHKLYVANVCAVRTDELGRLARATAAAALVIIAFDEALEVGPSPAVVLVGAAAVFAVVSLLRGAYSGWLRSCRARGRFSRPVCVLGDGDEVVSLVELLASQPDLGYRPVAIVGDPSACPGRPIGVPVIDAGHDLVGAVRWAGASGVIIGAGAFAPEQMDEVVRRLLDGGLYVQISTGLARIGHQRLRISPVSHQLIFSVEPHQLSPWQARTKRALDLVLTSAGLFLVAPLMLAAAIAVKLGDGGKVIYRQERIGRGGKPFRVLKFRTMVPDASARLAELAELNERNGPLFKLRHDPRVTRVGRILRATSIDELPQLFNVLRGEMSLVGPRPALPSEVAQFDSELRERESIQPGITGLWQVEAGESPSFDAYRRLDLFYVENWSVGMDIGLLLATVGVVLGRGFRALRPDRDEADDAGRPQALPIPFGRRPQPNPSLTALSQKQS